jgi:radical SAM superfamily enzyme YgiQ (UPF0313 family)
MEHRPMAEIVLIHPRFDSSYWGLEHALGLLGGKAVLPVASLPLLAALTPPCHRVTLIDENVEPIDFDRCARADIVGLTGMFVQRAHMREILTELRRRDVFIVVGGPWITVQEADFGDLVDVVFVGEADETWPQFLDDWAAGRHVARYEQTERTDLTKLPVPRVDLLPMKHYRFGSIQMTRGCPFTCEFCDIIVVFGRQPRIKTSAQILAELDVLLAAGKSTVFIVDDNLIGNKKAIKAVLREVIAWQETHGYPITFATEASIDLAEDDELMRLMVDANIAAVFVGIETPNEASLRETKKIQNLADPRGTMLDKVHRIQQAGMEVWSGMIVGFDNDDATVFECQRRFIEDAHIVNTMVNMLVAIPKTPLFARLERENRLDHSDEAFRRGSNVIPRQLSPTQLRDGCAALMRDLYAPAAYFDRLDTLYLERGLRPAVARSRYLRRHPIRRLAANTRLLSEAFAIILQLMRRIPDAALRREYRHRLWRAAKCRPEPAVLQVYALKCALHFHAFMMARQMMSYGAAVEKEGKEDQPKPRYTATESMGVSA